jgi:hypothetical protein
LYFYGRLLMLYVQFKGKQEDKKKAHRFPFLQGPNLMSWSHYKFLQLPKPQYLIQTCRRAPPSVYIAFVSCALCQWNNSVTSSWRIASLSATAASRWPEIGRSRRAMRHISDDGRRRRRSTVVEHVVCCQRPASRPAIRQSLRHALSGRLSTWHKSKFHWSIHACCISPRLHGVCEYSGK